MTITGRSGPLFPGLAILLIGSALFALWLLLVFVSFFAFFIPLLRGIFYLALDILALSIILMGSGALIMVAGASGWNQMGSEGGGRRRGWFGGAVIVSTERDRMEPGERAWQVVWVLVSILVLAYFIENQLRGTGFFTSRFSLSEEVLFYGTWILNVGINIARAAYGRRNALRPFDALNGALLVVTAVWLLNVFPFDFSHLRDLLPASEWFLLFWVSNPIGILLIALAGIGGFASLVYNVVMYAAVRSRQHYGGLPQVW
jgi:hypothetical protein